ncbi:MAG: hypothetical protein WCK56_14650, partial [Alcaligenaceae bacterium]
MIPSALQHPVKFQKFLIGSWSRLAQRRIHSLTRRMKSLFVCKLTQNKPVEAYEVRQRFEVPFQRGNQNLIRLGPSDSYFDDVFAFSHELLGARAQLEVFQQQFVRQPVLVQGYVRKWRFVASVGQKDVRLVA